MSAEGTVFWNLRRYGAPLSNKGTPGRRLSVEKTLAEGVKLSRYYPSVAQVWPVVFSKNRKQVRVSALERLSEKLGQTKALGFLLSVTRKLLGDRALLKSEKRLRRKSSSASEYFFLGPCDDLYRALTKARTPEEARAWAFMMNTQYEDFESCFRKFCS